MMSVGAPASMFSFRRWLILMMSTSLWVKSSSERIPDSNVIEGRTYTGGTGNTWRTIHSGRATFGLKPKISRSSSETRSSLSRIMLGVSGSEPNSVCSMNLVGFSKVILNCGAAQYGHCLALMSVMISL